MSRINLNQPQTRFLAGVLSLTVILFASWVMPTSHAEQTQQLHQNLPHFGQLIEQNSAAVVNIRIEGKIAATANRPDFQGQIPDDLRKFFENSPFGERFFERMPQQPLAGQGSGFIISEDGYIITNAHVVDRADKILVRLNDRQEYQAELIGSDKRTDIALLKINASNLPAVKIGDSNTVGVGDWVLAIGSPFGFEQSASQGIVSALGRSLPDGTYVPFIQTDAAVNPGNSGGPLFNLDGEVIGVNSQIYSRSGGYMGLSFAIPVNVAMNVVEQIKDTGSVSRGWLGVMIQDLDHDLAQSFGLEKPRGALVAQVLSDSPAEAAGVQVGDVILSYDGKNLRRSSALPPLVGVTPVGTEVEITVLRDGKERTLSLAIAKLDDGDHTTELATTSSAKNGKLGIAVADIASAEREKLEIENGVLVQDVEPASPAAEAGLRSGDIILSFNRKDVNSAKQLAEMVRSAPDDEPAVILIQRDNGRMFVPVPLG